MRPRASIRTRKPRGGRLRCGDSTRSKNRPSGAAASAYSALVVITARPGCRKAVARTPRDCPRAPAALHCSAMRAFSKREVREFYRRLAETRPIPQTELEFINPFTLLVAVVLSAQATDTGVNKATPALFAVADTPQKMLELGEERVTQLIRTIGLYRTKARNLIALSRILVERHGG